MQGKRFEFEYCAPTEKERKIAEKICREYGEEKELLTRLQALDKRVKRTPMYLSIALGIIGTLIFGGGLSLVLEFDLLLVGVGLSTLGLLPIALAYPVYKWSFHKAKGRYGQEILALAEQALRDEE